MLHAETVTFGGSGLDRAAHLRGAPERIAALLADPSARILPLWRGKVAVEGERGEALYWLSPGHAALAEAAAPPVFLGLDAAGPRFAADVSAWTPNELDTEKLTAFYDPTEYRHPAMARGARFLELRAVMALVSARDAELAATAKGLFSWHGTHEFCARCGQPSAITMAGWQRGCASCGAQHFPRTDPVVIVLVTRGNSVLLGRSPAWPAKMYSLLAGFMEPGETIEAACRREVCEEAGIRIGRVEYLVSQPWPFPSSLMIGCRAEALNQDIRLDPQELEDATWVTREELLAVRAGLSDRVLPARRGSVAHFIIKNWLGDNLG